MQMGLMPTPIMPVKGASFPRGPPVHRGYFFYSQFSHKFYRGKPTFRGAPPSRIPLPTGPPVKGVPVKVSQVLYSL
jgi:hypothetical protein